MIGNSTRAEQLHSLRRIAEERLEAAKIEADRLRAAHAAAVLIEQFPNHTVAVFGRAVNEDTTALWQLLSTGENVPDLDLDDEAAVRELTPVQRSALDLADRAIALIGDDEAIQRHLTGQVDEHQDWVEFDLRLAEQDPSDSGIAVR